MLLRLLQRGLLILFKIILTLADFFSWGGDNYHLAMDHRYVLVSRAHDLPFQRCFIYLRSLARVLMETISWRKVCQLLVCVHFADSRESISGEEPYVLEACKTNIECKALPAVWGPIISKFVKFIEQDFVYIRT